jgi:hypothetical protein
LLRYAGGLLLLGLCGASLPLGTCTCQEGLPVGRLVAGLRDTTISLLIYSLVYSSASLSGRHFEPEPTRTGCGRRQYMGGGGSACYRRFRYRALEVQPWPNQRRPRNSLTWPSRRRGTTLACQTAAATDRYYSMA